MNKIVCFLLSFLTFTFAFNQVDDAAYWSELKIEKKINLRSSIGLCENIRLNENWSQLSTHFTQLEYNFKLLSQLNFSLAYRFAQKFKYDETMNYRNRFMFDVNYSFKFNRISIGIRERAQIQYQDALQNRWGEPISTFRSKLNFEYDLEKKIKPFISGELFLENFNFLNNVRFAFGFNYKFNKKLDLDVSYIINKELQIENPTNYYIVSTSLKYLF